MAPVFSRKAKRYFRIKNPISNSKTFINNLDFKLNYPGKAGTQIKSFFNLTPLCNIKAFFNLVNKHL